MCKSYALENFCEYESGCAYHHKEENTNNEINKKVVELERIVDSMSRKIGELENKIKVIELKEIEVEEMKESNKIVQHAPMIGSNF